MVSGFTASEHQFMTLQYQAWPLSSSLYNDKRVRNALLMVICNTIRIGNCVISLQVSHIYEARNWQSLYLRGPFTNMDNFNPGMEK